MDAERFARIKAILLELETLADTEHEAYLDRTCGDDAELRREVEALLHQNTGRVDFLESPELASAMEQAAAPRPGPRTPETLGPYRLLDVLGEGGMGIVYRAQQTEPIEREVAVKRIRGGLDTARVVARFESERQTLARMDHPNIARVLDAGADATGQPYVVMELVPGVPITEYARTRKLSRGALLRLFVQVCRGVQHAHQKGVIHRDLKPSNILVTEQDGDPVPKIIDFGIAKALEDDPSQVTLTREGQLVGTLEYMSPEQATGGTEALDTRSDVYSLGIILYQLLTEHLPYTTQGLSLADALQTVARATPAPLRHTSPGSPRTDTDLETVLFKALEKSPDRRYPGAGALADDLERYQRKEPISARPPSATYQLRKLISRHRGPVAAVATLFVLLSAFAVSMAFQVQAQRRERARAEAETVKAREISAFLQGMLASADPGETGQRLTLDDVLDLAARDLGLGLENQPDVRAALHATLGNAYRALARYDAAEEHLQAALDLRTGTHGSLHPDVITSLMDLASIRIAETDVDQQKLVLADSLLQDATARSMELNDNTLMARSLYLRGDVAHNLAHYGEADSLFALSLNVLQSSGDRGKVAEVLNRRAYAVFELGEADRAVALSREAFALGTADLGREHVATAGLAGDLAYFLSQVAAFDEAESLYTRAIRIETGARGDAHPKVGKLYSNLGTMYEQAERYPQAESALRTALAIRSAALGDTSYYVANDYNALATVLDKQGKVDESRPLFESALAIYRSNLGDRHPTVLNGRSNLATLLMNHGRYQEAADIQEEILPLRQEVHGPLHFQTGISHHTLATCYNRLGDWDRAEPHTRATIDCWTESMGRGHVYLAFAKVNEAHTLHGRGQLEGAEAVLGEVLEMTLEAFGDPSPPVAGTRGYLARLFHDQGRLAEALREAAACANAYLLTSGPDTPLYGDMVLILADVELSTGDIDSAATHARAGLQVLVGDFPDDHFRIAYGLLLLALAEAKAGDTERLRSMTNTTLHLALTHPGHLRGERERTRERASAAFQSLGDTDRVRFIHNLPRRQ